MRFRGRKELKIRDRLTLAKESQPHHLQSNTCSDFIGPCGSSSLPVSQLVLRVPLRDRVIHVANLTSDTCCFEISMILTTKLTYKIPTNPTQTCDYVTSVHFSRF